VSEANKAVFLSYAKQDAAAAGKICEALRAAGIEVWFDQSALRGGDAWDAAIRKQIKTCALLLPIISGNTQNRAEGYFRLEWKLAVDRSHLMSQDRAFLVPVVIDQTSEEDERVPDRFREVQWSRLPGGETNPAFVERIKRLLAQDTFAPLQPVEPLAPQSKNTAAPPNRKGLMPWLAALVVLCGGVGWFTRSMWMHTAVVTPYTNEDRRMTFALLPFQAPADDQRAQQVAKATSEELQTMLETRKDLITAIPLARVEQAAAHETSIRKLAKELDVHFLVRGTVARSADGYSVTMFGVDGASERVIQTRVLKVPQDQLVPRWRNDVGQVSGALITAGMDAEVKRVRDKPDDALDVRDLSYRAVTDWFTTRDADGKVANETANRRLARALTLAPDDPYSLRVQAMINLCDCVNSWSKDPEVQKAAGAAALDKYLRLDPTSHFGLGEKAALDQLRGRWEDSVILADAMLQSDPDDQEGLGLKATAYLRLRRLKEAQVIADGLMARYPTDWGVLSTASDIDYALGDYSNAAQIAKKATAQMAAPDLRDRVSGAVQLTLIAAEARLKHADRAKAAISDFNTTLPALTTLTAIKKWVHPSADLADFEPLYEGLSLAGIPN
jgi:TolB-like protein/tetratricopeptide (TPR) repeat protein